MCPVSPLGHLNWATWLGGPLQTVSYPQRSRVDSLPGAAAIDVVAILLDGMDLVVLGLAGAVVPPTRARAVVARARSKGACLVVTEGRLDGAPHTPEQSAPLPLPHAL